LATFDFYKNTYCGDLNEERFCGLITKADVLLSEMTAGKSDSVPKESRDGFLKDFALCVLCDELSIIKESMGKTKEKAGSFSVSYRKEMPSLFKAISPILGRSGLLAQEIG